MLKTLSVAAAYILAANLSHASIIVTVGDTALQPNQAGQSVPIFVSSDGTPEVSGFNLVAQLGDGQGEGAEPVFSGVAGTREGVDFLTDAIWPADTASASGEVPTNGAPQFATAAITIANNGAVVADGRLVTLLVDTTGFNEGSFPLLLSGSQGNDSNFVIPGGDEFDPEIRNGSIFIVPEPGAVAMLFGAVLVFTFRLRSCTTRA